MNASGRLQNRRASCGTALTTKQALLLKRYSDEIIICYDNDDAGIAATEKAIDILEGVGFTVYVISIRDAKDPDEFIKKFGAKQFYQPDKK
nr:toprim domain-containing protein [Ruminococcus albus]